MANASAAGNADGDEPLPGAAGGRDPGTCRLEHARGHMKLVCTAEGLMKCFKERRGVRNQRHHVAVAIRGQIADMVVCGQQIGGCQMLGGQNAVHGLERELGATVQKIGEMAFDRIRSGGRAKRR